MKYNIAKPDKVFKAANIATRKRNFKLWIATQILVRKKQRRYAYISNFYLRWVDDIIDSPTIIISEKEKFLTRQYHLLESFVNISEVELISFEENYLYYIISYAKENNRHDIINYFKINFDAFALDIHRLRHGGNFTRQELEQYISLLLKPVFNLTISFILPNMVIPKNQDFIGKFFYYVLSLRDFTEDLEAGYINICKEDVTKYKINLKDICNDSNLFKWAEESYPEILAILNKEMEILSGMPLLVRILWFPGLVDQNKDLIRIKYYNFKIGHELRREFLGEIRIVFLAIIQGFYIMKKVFF